MDERTWWNRWGHLNERVWQYNPRLTAAVRREYLAELETFLFKPGGRLLDIGCGHGWVSLPLARRGMWVDGIDLSEVQIREAWRRAAAEGLENVRFWQADARSIQGLGQYDAIVVHALLHHLHPNDQAALLNHIATLLTDGGRAYLYEPLAARAKRPLPAVLFDKGMGGLFRGLTWLAQVTRVMAPEFIAARRDGWTMRTPDEAPIQLDTLLANLPTELTLVRITVWQVYATSYANWCMMLRQPWQEWASRLAPWVYRLDRHIVARSWYRYLRVWPMAGIALEKKPAL